jgi:hypothetical protein
MVVDSFGGGCGVTLTLAHLSTPALDHRPSIDVLTSRARLGGLVMVCARCPTGTTLARMRRLFAGHRLVAVVVDHEVAADERRLIRELLDEGAVTLALTPDEPDSAELANWLWLAPDDVLVLPVGSGG